MAGAAHENGGSWDKLLAGAEVCPSSYAPPPPPFTPPPPPPPSYPTVPMLKALARVGVSLIHATLIRDLQGVSFGPRARGEPSSCSCGVQTSQPTLGLVVLRLQDCVCLVAEGGSGRVAGCRMSMLLMPGPM